MTHDQYMDTPVAEVEWMLRIDEVHKAAERRQQAPPGPSTPRIG